LSDLRAASILEYEGMSQQDTNPPGGLFDLTGHTIGRYRLIEKLGQGGMAQVYKAYQPNLDRCVAIKVLHPYLVGNADFAARFRREARAIAALEHPHIVRVYDFDSEGEVAFLVMEYLEGSSLKAVLRDLDRQNMRMDLQEAVRIIATLADALDYAHRQGMVHRDIKPSNVVITTDGRPVLTDFGIAHMVDSTAVTGSSGVLGTPAYMSPEQGKGQPGDARSDIYALGVLLYQLCTGRVPFDADTPYAIVLKHITAPLPRPCSLNPDLPEAVERVILKALAKDPDDRFQSAGDLGRALRAAVEGQGKTQSRPRHRRTVPPWAMRTIVAILALAFVVAALFASRPWRYIARIAARPAPTLAPGERATLVVQGRERVADTWLDPDVPDVLWGDADLAHLQGPLTPDRLLFRFDLTGLPANIRIVSATLTLKVELWGNQSLPGAAVAYRALVPWDAATANYGVPWSAPGLAAGIDYDSVPLDLVPVPDSGPLTFDVTEAVRAWAERGQPNYGLVVMMSADSHNMAHHWVMMSEQADAADRPTLAVVYEAGP
jgi:tRNA A-37 threonylcarbamoyl transferase component Bud32